MLQVTHLTKRALIMTIASMTLAACSTSPPGNVTGLRRVVGTDLIGARGATERDQRKIDRTVAGICAGKVWSADECRRHGAGR